MKRVDLYNVISFAVMSLLLVSCTATGSSTSLPSPAEQPSSIPIAPTRVPTLLLSPTRAPAITSIPTPTTPNRTETTTIKVHFDTYETEETIGAELGKVRGIIGVVTTQIQITVIYDPQVLTRAEIIKVMNQNPEVRVEEP